MAGIRSHRSPPSSTERLAAITLTAIAIASPLFIDRKAKDADSDYEMLVVGSSHPSAFSFLWTPLVLLILILAINLSNFVECRHRRFDPYWIHRVGGSSGGILAALLLLGLIVKFKTSWR